VKGPRGEAALLALVTGLIPGYGTYQKVAKKGVAGLNPFGEIGGRSSSSSAPGLLTPEEIQQLSGGSGAVLSPEEIKQLAGGG
jgi:hypothetical protein